eukprot:PhF_6_TR20500/c0_g1_i4/m.29540
MAFGGKVVLVTGASSGIGAAAAKKFASLSATLALFGRNEVALGELAGSLPALGCPKALPVVCDVAKEEDVVAAVQAVITNLGRIDVLINCAGVLVGGTAGATTTEVFDANFSVNTRGAFLMMQQCIPHLEKTKGNIVNVSSITGMHSFQGVMAYCASKAALDMMTQCAAADLAPKGVRVNSVNPGVVKTELQRKGGMSEETTQT